MGAHVRALSSFPGEFHVWPREASYMHKTFNKAMQL